MAQLIFLQLERIRESFSKEKIILDSKEIKVILKNSSCFDESLISGEFYTYLFSSAFYDQVDHILICNSWPNERINEKELTPMSKLNVNNFKEMFEFLMKNDSFWPENMKVILYLNQEMYTFEYQEINFDEVEQKIYFKLDKMNKRKLIPKGKLDEGILFIYKDKEDIEEVIKCQRDKCIKKC